LEQHSVEQPGTNGSGNGRGGDGGPGRVVVAPLDGKEMAM